MLKTENMRRPTLIVRTSNVKRRTIPSSWLLSSRLKVPRHLKTGSAESLARNSPTTIRKIRYEVYDAYKLVSLKCDPLDAEALRVGEEIKIRKVVRINLGLM